MKSYFRAMQCKAISVKMGIYVSFQKLAVSEKWHSQLWNRADLDTSFLTLKKVPLNLKSKFIYKSALIFAVFSLTFNRVLKNLFLSGLLLILRYYFYHIWLKTVKNSMDCVSVICKLAMKWYLMRMCTS